jgi:hypothetical protein
MQHAAAEAADRTTTRATPSIRQPGSGPGRGVIEASADARPGWIRAGTSKPIPGLPSPFAGRRSIIERILPSIAASRAAPWLLIYTRQILPRHRRPSCRTESVLE